VINGNGLVEVTHVGSIDARVIIRVRSWEAKQFVLGGDSCATPANIDLLAGGVELGFTFLGCQMEGDDLVPDQVLPRSKILWKISGVSLPIHFIRA